MAWIKVIDEAEAAEKLREVYDDVIRERGKLSNIMRAQSLNAEAMARHLGLYATLMFGESALTRAEREFIAVVVSSANRCEYCVNHHAHPLRLYWKDDERVDAAIGDWREGPFSPRERALAAYAEKLTRAPAHVAAEDVAALRARGLSDRDILDVNMITAYFNFVNRVAAGLGVEYTPEEVRGYKT
ncbi:MAG: peroxidase-related enzyme [candidate division Zixibacteria bacterium]|nr:peroxidase-related enzyme [candidate division Zixibacteria bacterium]